MINKGCKSECWHLGVAGFFAFIWVGSGGINTDTQAQQVTADPTLGTRVTPNGAAFEITGGTTVGNTNLFHSFSSFSVPIGRTADFLNGSNIDNIFARVTGGSISDIQGLIRARGTANLFLMNPNGIIFGSGAQLNIGGSFVATTASAIAWTNGGVFSVSSQVDANNSLLRVNPNALLFNQIATSSIENRSIAPAGVHPAGFNISGLRVPDGKSLLFVGGNVSMDGGWLNAADGRIELGGLAQAGTVGLNVDGNDLRLSFPDGVERADVSLTNRAIAAVPGKDGGTVVVNARNINVVNGSLIAAGIEEGLGTLNSQAGDIILNATQTVTLNNSNIDNYVDFRAEGSGGNIDIKASSVSLNNSAKIFSSVYGKGDAGNININVADSMIAFNSSNISADNFGQGDAGNVTINAGNIVFLYENSFIKANNYEQGNGGDITINAGNTVAFDDGAFVLAVNTGQGNAGNVTINAGNTVTFDSSAFIQANNTSQGNAGNVTINAGNTVTFDSGAFIVTDNNGQGNAGNVAIKAGDKVSFFGLDKRGGVFARALLNARNGGNINIEARSLELSKGADLIGSTFGRGTAGNITINVADSLIATDGSHISADNGGLGNASNVSINAGNTVSFDGNGGGIFAISLNSSGLEAGFLDNSQAGNINVQAKNISLTNGAVLQASTFSRGNAGNINMTATDTITFDGVGSRALSIAGAQAVGKAGDINVDARNIFLTNGATLEASTYSRGNAGNINLAATDTIAFNGTNSGISSSVQRGAFGKGGDIILTTGSLLVTNGAEIYTNTFGNGDAGSIRITARDTVSFDGVNSDGYGSVASTQVARTAVGNGGDIYITTKSLSLTNGGYLSTDTEGKGNAGSIWITARDTVSFDGVDSYGYGSAASTEVERTAVGNGGDIHITTKSLSLANGGYLSTLTRGKGDAGSVFIEANESVSVANSEIRSQTVLAVGNSGNINIKAESLSLTDRASLNTKTFGEGNAGNVFVQASGEVSLLNSEISSRVTFAGVGNGGNIDINARSVFLTEGSQLESELLGGQGKPGNITIVASDTISFSGKNASGAPGGIRSGLFPSVLLQASPSTTFGKGGDVNLQARTIVLSDDASVDSTVQLLNGGTGKGGNIQLIASDSVSLTNRASLSTNSRFSGDGGDINIWAGSLSLTNGSLIETSASGQGDAGNVFVQTNQFVSLDNSNIFTNLKSRAVGNGGDIKITTGSLSLTNGGQLSASTFGEGSAGSLFVKADSVEVSGNSPDGQSVSGLFTETRSSGNANNLTINTGQLIVRDRASISAATFAQGRGGNIQVQANSLSLRNFGNISSRSEGQGQAGSIFVNVRDPLEANNGDISTNSLQSSGGDINITAKDIRLRGDSDITTNVFSGAGGGGNITLTANSIIAFDDSDILAYAQDGRGGDITLNTSAFFGVGYRPASVSTLPETLDGNSRVDVNASGRVAGVVSIPDTTFLQNSLTEFQQNPIDTQALIANSCIARGDRQEGTFTITGSGGLPHRPGVASISTYSTGDVRHVQDESASRPWREGDPIVEPQGVYRLPSGRLVLSRECGLH